MSCRKLFSYGSLSISVDGDNMEVEKERKNFLEVVLESLEMADEFCLGFILSCITNIVIKQHDYGLVVRLRVKTHQLDI